MVFEAIAGGLVKAALPKAAGAIATAVKNKLHPTELQRSLEVGLRTSGAFERGQKVNNAVFYRCTDKDVDTFLAALLEHPETQRELQKPLEQDGAPDVAILVQVAKQIATDRTLDIPNDTLEPWLKTFANAYFDAITAIRFQVAKADYLKQLVTRFDDVQFLGVALDRHEETKKQLAQIFVMPDVEEERRTSRASLEFDIRPGEDWREALETQGNRQSQLLQEQRLRSQLERSSRKFSARQLLNQHQKKVVLLGAPGSGKTTLMSFFAVELAERQGAIAPASDAHAEGSDRDATRMQSDAEGSDRHTEERDRDRTRMVPDAEGLRLDTQGLQTDADALPLPILIRIRDWARTPDVTIPEYARQFAETTMSCKPLPKGFFEHWLNNGRALILLDGLDEVAEQSKQYHLVQCIENFLGQYPQNRAIITSRPAGYKRDFFRTEEFPHYELQPFDDGKIEEFCDRWYRSRVQDTAEALRRKESLQKALNQQDRIKLLARNPLLLTIIALIHRYQARLPRERYKLYDKAVETLLTSWDDNKELSNQTVLQYLQLDDLRRLMESLAYWIHTQGNTGDREGGTLIDKDKLIQRLCQEIKTLKQLQHYEAKAEAERFVKFIRDRTGLLNEQGQDCYAFVHKTFQEYLAAQDINYQADNEDDFAIVLTHIEQHLHDPHWREVLLLLIAQQSPKKAARAIRKVLTANSPYEQWLYRDLLFAGRCLAEDPKGLQVADAPLVAQLLEQMVALEISDSKMIGNSVRSQVMQVLCSLSETVYESQALSVLKAAAAQIDDDRLRKYQVELGDAEAAFSPLLALLQDSNSDLRVKAAFALRELGNVSEVFLQGLLALFKDPDSNVRAIAAEGCCNSGNAPDVVLQGLLSLFKDPDSDVRCGAANGLSSLGNAPDVVLQGLFALLKDTDPEVRSLSAFVLGNLGKTSDDLAVQELLNLLQDKDSNVRSNAAFALGELGDTSDVLLQDLLNLLQDTNVEVRANGAEALGKLGHASDVVLQGLVTLLQDADVDVRANGAEALGKLRRTSDVVLQGLVALLQDANVGVRVIAAEALDKLGNASDMVLQGLLTLLQDGESSHRFIAAEALGKLGNASDMVLQGLLTLLQDREFYHRFIAAEALGKLGNASDVVLQGLLTLLQEEEPFPHLSGTAEALGKLGKRSNQVEPAIVQWIEQHQDEDCVGAGIDALWEIVGGEG